MIAIIDYGAGNIRSIEKALAYVGAQVQVTSDADVVAEARAVVLPGVGSGGAAMARMTERGLDNAIRQATQQGKPFLSSAAMARMTERGLNNAIRQATQQGKPFLGICLGMQLLADHHAEGEVDGLGLFRGTVQRIPHGPKIPHMGWNQVTPLRENLAIFDGIPRDTYFYFAHSYYVEPQDQQGVAAVTDYGSPYCSVIVTEHVWGTQFHPEKSGEVGLQLLSNFVKWVHA